MLLKHKPALSKWSIGIIRSLVSEELLGQESFAATSLLDFIGSLECDMYFLERPLNV